MQPHIRDAIEALLKIDSTVTAAERKRFLAPMDGKAPMPPDRLLSPKEAAERFGRGPRSLENWVRRGLLKKWKMPGVSRSVGFRESDVVALLQTAGLPESTRTGRQDV